jgi:hypothetical protein
MSNLPSCLRGHFRSSRYCSLVRSDRRFTLTLQHCTWQIDTGIKHVVRKENSVSCVERV